MPEELRHVFHGELAKIHQQVVELFGLVTEGLAGATDAFLAGDRDAARSLMARDEVIDAIYRDVEDLVQRQFALQAPIARDLRFLLSVLRIVPELERSGDLAEHIAQRAERAASAELTPRIRGLITQMGSVAGEMWRRAADAYVDSDPDAAEGLRLRDDELDDLHVSLTAELASGVIKLPIAIEVALVGRFYERLGDHAVNVTHRLRYLVTGVS